MFFILFAIAVGFAFGADIFDVVESEKAYAKGYVESFDWLVGSKPTAIALYLRDGMLIAFASAPALILFLLHSTPVAYGALAGPIAAGARHIQGGLGAKKLK
jgi:hypothetical protein